MRTNMNKLFWLMAALLITLTGCGSVDWFPANSSTSSGANPQAITFIAQSNVAPNATVTSNAVTITGNSQPVAIAISNGEYAIDGGSYTSTAGTISSGQKVTVQQTSASTPGTATYTVLTVGSVVAVFTSTTRTTNPNPPTEIPVGATDTTGTFTLVSTGFNEAFRDTATVTEQIIIELQNNTTTSYYARVGFYALDAGNNIVYTGFVEGLIDPPDPLLAPTSTITTDATINGLATYASIAKWIVFSIERRTTP